MFADDGEHLGGREVFEPGLAEVFVGARFAVIVGDDEAAANAVSVKPLRKDAQQVRVPIDEAVRLIREKRDL